MKRLALLALIAASPTFAQDTSPAKLIAGYEAQSGKAADPAAGRAFYLAAHGTGKPETPSCTTCHTKSPKASGQTRVGKVIDPLAPSANRARFTDSAKVEKWFGRNCDSVLGRACTAAEKANLIAWLASL
ncbi:DUF1924 domain-containing protein [Rhodovulum adriaticum]|uniref:Uncharacterized protein DUF1924 n=1 Tax=Rhodovulum adriaticum TaxID=35804 RepID=A0A4R2NMX7_RHOAD|nr:DUF1924 domain-containing protein [Rhodovulum adriaticum]MBK1634578.1 nitrate reductase [Rhodovulum adriaticum]TCP23053.1 uncharacterized protein DUF1924 [Rhodovulum adriaticum]